VLNVRIAGGVKYSLLRMGGMGYTKEELYVALRMCSNASTEQPRRVAVRCSHYLLVPVSALIKRASRNS